MNDTAEPLYDGPDPFLSGHTAKWAAYLETLDPVPRTIDAILAKVPDCWKPRACLEIHAAEYGPDLEKAMARWWGVARQWISPEELQQRVNDVLTGRVKCIPASEVFPGWDERQAARDARSDEEKAAEQRQWEERRAQEDRERAEQSRQYLAWLDQLAADERAYTAAIEADRQRKQGA